MQKTCDITSEQMVDWAKRIAILKGMLTSVQENKEFKRYNVCGYPMFSL